MNHRWAIRVADSYSWFESLVNDHNPVDVGFMVDALDAQPNQYMIVSHHLDRLDDPSQVIDRATVLIALLDGALYLQHAGFAGMQTIDLISIESGSRWPLTNASVLVSPFSATWKNSQVPANYGDLTRPTERMLFMSRDDELTCDLLRFLGVNGPTWIALYALKDYMKRGGWDERAIAQAAGVHVNEVALFRHTANNPAAIGPFARHGAQGHARPAKPMELNDARSLILGATGKFLDERSKTRGVAEEYASLSLLRR